jgi:hypothetical protein
MAERASSPRPGVLALLAANCQAGNANRGNDEHAPPSSSPACGRLCLCCPCDGLHTSSDEDRTSPTIRTKARRGDRGASKTPTAFAGNNSPGAARSGGSFRLESRALSLELHGAGERTGSRFHLATRPLRRTAVPNVRMDQRKLVVARRLVGVDARILAIEYDDSTSVPPLIAEWRSGSENRRRSWPPTLSAGSMRGQSRGPTRPFEAARASAAFAGKMDQAQRFDTSLEQPSASRGSKPLSSLRVSGRVQAGPAPCRTARMTAKVFCAC